jgi:hypothetical protein
MESDARANGKQSVNQAGWASVKVYDEIETPQQQLQRLGFSPDRKNFIDIRVPFKTTREAGFHENRDAKSGEFVLQGTDRAGEQQAISHRAQAYKKDSRFRAKPEEEILSLQPSLR